MFLSHDNREFCRLIGDVPLETLRQLTELDYCKALVADRMISKLPVPHTYCVAGVPGIAKISSHTVFECIHADELDGLMPAEFLSVRFKYDYQQ